MNLNLKRTWMEVPSIFFHQIGENFKHWICYHWTSHHLAIVDCYIDYILFVDCVVSFVSSEADLNFKVMHT